MRLYMSVCKRLTAALTNGLAFGYVLCSFNSMLPVPFQTLGAGVPLFCEFLNMCKVLPLFFRHATQFPFFGMLAVVFFFCNTFEVLNGVVIGVSIFVVYVIPFWDFAIVELPHIAVHTGASV